MGRLIDIDDERFWDILFDEACVEGQQATRIRNELEKIIAYDVEKVVEKIRKSSDEEYIDMYGEHVPPLIATEDAIEIIHNGGKE